MQFNRIWKYFTAGNSTTQPQTEEIPSTALEEKQQLLAHHVRLVARGLSNGLFVFGSRGGLGKTKTILKTLARERVRPVLLNGHVTPLALYTTLFSNSEEVIVIDDADNLYRNLAALGILRSALWGDDQGTRLVTYNSSALKIPSSFNFNGRLILTANTLPRRNHAFDAVLSRVDIFELDASNEEVVELMRLVATNGFQGKLSAADCLEVVDFIASFSATRELSLRLLEPSFQKVLYARHAGCDWRDLVRSQLEQMGIDNQAKPADSKGYDLDCLKQVLEQYPDSVTDQQQVWCELTRRSRATFFRLKKALLSEDRKEDEQEPGGDHKPAEPQQ